MSNTYHLAAASLALVLLTFAVGLRMLAARTSEMKQLKIHPQSTATSLKMAARLTDVQAADNFRNLFEVPVLFYALMAMAVATAHAPPWLVIGAWLFVTLRVVHSAIHCSYNTVMHRFAAFGASLLLVVVLWVAFVVTLAPQAGG